MKREWMVQQRKDLGMTQEQIARAIGISRSYYTEIENGTHTPSGKTALRISTFFNVDMSIFFCSECRENRQTEEANV